MNKGGFRSLPSRIKRGGLFTPMNESPRRPSLFDRIIDIAAVIVGILFVYSTVGTCVEVVMRYFFNKPTNWILESNEYVLYIAPFLAAAWILKHDGHIKMDLIVNALSPRNQALLNAATSLVGLLVSLTIAWFGVMVTLDSFRTGYITSSGHIRINRGYFMVVGALGCLLLSIEFSRRAISYFRQMGTVKNLIPDQNKTPDGV
ncbi:MAG: TRAP transporter small permease [Deltaproteobacteria bacterium]|nr:TRAP transporter small permease [Deltaproteobacteria bacterium]